MDTEWDHLTEAQQEQLKQVFRQGMVSNFNLIHQEETEKLVDLGFLDSHAGYTFIERLPRDFPQV